MKFLDNKIFYVIVYLIIINIAAFAEFGIDKHKAQKGQWRISEKELLFLAFIGGSMGALLGMKYFRHKTRKPAFSTGLPLILIFHIFVIGAVFFSEVYWNDFNYLCESFIKDLWESLI